MLSQSQLTQLNKEIQKQMDLLDAQRTSALDDVVDPNLFERSMIGEGGVNGASAAMLKYQGQLLLLRAQTRLDNLVRRFEELKRGEFDTQCAECGEEIDFSRILAQPTTTHCLSCKQQAEEKKMRSGFFFDNSFRTSRTVGH